MPARPTNTARIASLEEAVGRIEDLLVQLLDNPAPARPTPAPKEAPMPKHTPVETPTSRTGVTILGPNDTPPAEATLVHVDLPMVNLVLGSRKSAKHLAADLSVGKREGGQSNARLSGLPQTHLNKLQVNEMRWLLADPARRIVTTSTSGRTVVLTAG